MKITLTGQGKEHNEMHGLLSRQNVREDLTVKNNEVCEEL